MHTFFTDLVVVVDGTRFVILLFCFAFARFFLSRRSAISSRFIFLSFLFHFMFCFFFDIHCNMFHLMNCHFARLLFFSLCEPQICYFHVHKSSSSLFRQHMIVHLRLAKMKRTKQKMKTELFTSTSVNLKEKRPLKWLLEAHSL